MVENAHDVLAVRAIGQVVGIDASRNRSGGARAHLIGILSAVEPHAHGIEQVHVWSYRELLDRLPDRPWLIKHCPAELAGSIFRQLWWQRTKFAAELAAAQCDVLLSTDAGSVCRFTPSVVMSRDMLSFEAGEIERYGISLARLRLLLLRSMQVNSLRQASGALFLTEYAAEVIQRFSGPLAVARVIPHGIGENFRSAKSVQPALDGGRLRCVYVSNADQYKHQWHVIDAVRMLREAGHDVCLELVGAGAGPAAARVADAVRRFDADGAFVKITGAVPHDAVPSFLAGADVFIFASSCENMPNTLIEAMASNVAIACSARGPMPEILQGGGEYFDPEDPQSICNALKKLVGSVDLRRAKALQAKELSQQFSWSRCAAETWRFLIDVAAAHPAAPRN